MVTEKVTNSSYCYLLKKFTVLHFHLRLQSILFYVMICNLHLGFFSYTLMTGTNCWVDYLWISMLLLLFCQRSSGYVYAVFFLILYSFMLTCLSFNRYHIASIPIALLRDFKSVSVSFQYTVDYLGSFDSSCQDVWSVSQCPQSNFLNLLLKFPWSCRKCWEELTSWKHQVYELWVVFYIWLLHSFSLFNSYINIHGFIFIHFISRVMI